MSSSAEWQERADRNRNTAWFFVVLSVAGVIASTAIFLATNERLVVVAIVLHMLYLAPAATAWTAHLTALRGLDSANRIENLLGMGEDQ